MCWISKFCQRPKLFLAYIPCCIIIYIIPDCIISHRPFHDIIMMRFASPAFCNKIPTKSPSYTWFFVLLEIQLFFCPCDIEYGYRSPQSSPKIRKMHIIQIILSPEPLRETIFSQDARHFAIFWDGVGISPRFPIFPHGYLSV